MDDSHAVLCWNRYYGLDRTGEPKVEGGKYFSGSGPTDD